MKIIIITILSITFSEAVSAKIFKCLDLSDSKTTSMTDFNSELPILKNEITFLNNDGSIQKQTKTNFITAAEACQQKLDFKADCTHAEAENNLGYQYEYKCPKYKLSGRFNVDEAGFGEYECDSPSMNQRSISVECLAQ
jgi:hypothetical protein